MLPLYIQFAARRAASSQVLLKSKGDVLYADSTIWDWVINALELGVFCLARIES